MPKSGSNGYVAPTTEQRADWRSVVNQMLKGACGFTLPASLSANMQIRPFTDAGSGKAYCVLMEVLDADNNGRVDKGWGTFIVDSNATRQISHQAPHPIYDGDTARQAIGLFKTTNARSFLMCGAHRYANSGESACQSDYGPADCAHDDTSMFTATNQELDSYYGAGSWTAIQWHGMAADSCGTVSAFMSQGFTTAPASSTKLHLLKQLIADDHDSWDVRDPGDGGCGLFATNNVQGRILNGVNDSDACSTAATAPVGDKFIHIEQKPGEVQLAASWTNAVVNAWPVEEATLAAAADGYVRDGSYANMNYGGATSIQIRTSSMSGYSRIAFLRFDLDNLVGVLRATLRVYMAQSGSSEDLVVEVRPVSNVTWNEATLNWNNKPAMGAPLASVSTSGTSYAWYEFDVTDYVKQESAAGRSLVSFALYNPASSSPYIKAMSSKATANQPVLAIRR